MADNTHIEWTDATWNPITGCSVVSPGCTNCYAMRLAGTRLRHHPSRQGLTTDSKVGPVWNGQVRFNEGWLDQPLRWPRPRSIFVCAHGDLFHESVPDEWIDRVFAIMALAPRHTFQVLTKRPARMREYLQAASLEKWASACKPGSLKVSQNDVYRAFGMARKFSSDPKTPILPLTNVWAGVSIEDETRAHERIPILLDTSAAVRWISAEPLLGPVDLGPWIPTCYECGASCGLRLSKIPGVGRCVGCGEKYGPDTEPVFSDGCLRCGDELEPVCPDCGHYMVYQHPDTPNLDWVVVGGESGPGARPMHPDWVRQICDDCAAAGTAFLFKQWGAWAPYDQASSVMRRELPAAEWDEIDQRWDYLDPRNLADSDAADLANAGASYRIGKRAAGRLLDGVLHDALPEVRS